MGNPVHSRPGSIASPAIACLTAPTAPDPSTRLPNRPTESHRPGPRLSSPAYCPADPAPAPLPKTAIGAPNDNQRPPPAPFIGIERGPSRPTALTPCSNPKAAPHRWIRAKGVFLDGKLKVLEAMEDITSKERRFVTIAHEYRNELYHVGLTHDEIIRALAEQYFLLSCDLFTRLGNKGFFGPSFSSNDEYTDVAKRYLPVRNGRVLAFDVDKADLAEKLRSALPAGIPDLAQTLAASARKSIKSVTDEFAFLIQENPFGFDADKMLEVAQWQRDLTEALEREDVDGLWVDPNYRQGFSRVARALEAKWRQRHSSLPHERWMLRATAVERERDTLIALDLYQSLREDMSYLEESILSASTELDRWIQQQVDKSRGK